MKDDCYGNQTGSLAEDIILGILETSRHDVPSSLLVDHSIGPSFLILCKGVQISMMMQWWSNRDVHV